MSAETMTGAIDPDALVDAARAETDLGDFAGDEWREGLEHLVAAVNTESQANELGMEVIRGDLTGYLITRLRLVEWRRTHPEVARVDITAPIVIVGQARTGTTILFDLMSQDPALRAPLTWEVDSPFPPPETATFHTDPRIAETDERLKGTELLIPGFLSMHSMGATLAQECVRMTGGDFRSMIFPTQWRVPSYGRWLLDEADMSSAYRYHRMYLQHLGSHHPGRQWVIKSPGHIWCLAALLAEYPDARLIQTHRDPAATIASVSSLVALLRRIVQDETDIVDVAAEFGEYLIDGFNRSVEARRSGVVPPDQVVDVAFTDFLADPFTTIGGIYDELGMDYTAEAEQRMRDFLAAHPRDKHGRHRYTFADTGLDLDDVRARTAGYVDHFDVALGDLS